MPYYPRRKSRPPPRHVPSSAPVSQNWRSYLPAWRDVFWYILRTLGHAAALHFASALVKDLALSWREAKEVYKTLSDGPNPDYWSDWVEVPERIPDIDDGPVFDDDLYSGWEWNNQPGGYVEWT